MVGWCVGYAEAVNMKTCPRRGRLPADDGTKKDTNVGCGVYVVEERSAQEVDGLVAQLDLLLERQ
jgi:hypothetical protein